MNRNLKRVTLLTLLILASQLAFNLTAIRTTEAQPNVAIISHTSFLTSSYYYVVGEVKNEGNVPAANIQLQATYYDAANQVIKTENRSTILRILLAGRKTPFIFYGPITATRYELVLLQTYTPKPEGKTLALEILEFGVLDEENIIWGVIKNIGAANASLVTVTATFYDRYGNVAGMSSDPRTGADLAEVPAGTAIEFEIPIFPPARKEEYKGYAITAESLEYAVTQEIGPIQLSDDQESGYDPLISAAIIVSGIILISTFLLLKRRKKRHRKAVHAKIRK